MFDSVHPLIAAFREEIWDGTWLYDMDIFQSYLEQEQNLLLAQLRRFNFVIDGPDTLALITGPGRVEKVSGLSL